MPSISATGASGTTRSSTTTIFPHLSHVDATYPFLSVPGTHLQQLVHRLRHRRYLNRITLPPLQLASSLSPMARLARRQDVAKPQTSTAPTTRDAFHAAFPSVGLALHAVYMATGLLQLRQRLLNRPLPLFRLHWMWCRTPQPFPQGLRLLLLRLHFLRPGMLTQTTRLASFKKPSTSLFFTTLRTVLCKPLAWSSSGSPPERLPLQPEPSAFMPHPASPPSPPTIRTLIPLNTKTRAKKGSVTNHLNETWSRPFEDRMMKPPPARSLRQNDPAAVKRFRLVFFSQVCCLLAALVQG